MGLCLQRRLVLLLILFAGFAWPDEARRLFKAGRKAERQGHDVQAYLRYSQARANKPLKRKYVLAAAGVRRRAAQTLAGVGDLQTAAALAPLSFRLAAQQAAAQSILSNSRPPLLGDVPRALRGPVELKPVARAATFQLRGNIRSVYEKVAEAFGMIALFDEEFEGDEKIKFDLEDCGFAEAILGLNDIAGAFLVPVDERVFLVAEDSPTRRSELEPVATISLPLSNAMSPEEANEFGQLLQQVLDIKRLHVNNAARQLVVRDTVTRLHLAQALHRQLSHARAEVVVDVVLVSVNKSVEQTLGVTLPTSFPITNLSSILWNSPPEPDMPLLGIGGGSTVFGIAIGNALLAARRLASAGQVLTSFSLRATDGFPADFLVGERFPIVNARFSAIFNSEDIEDEIEQGTFREPFPSFTFEDLGLIFQVTPQVHSVHDISLALQLEVKQLTGRAVNDIPILSSRSLQSAFRLREGEVALISGLAIVEERRTRSGLALLSEIPWLGRLFRRQFRQLSANHLLVVVKPRLVRLPAAEMAPSLTLRYGPETRPLPPI